MTAIGHYAQRFSDALTSERPALAKFLLSRSASQPAWLEGAKPKGSMLTY